MAFPVVFGLVLLLQILPVTSQNSASCVLATFHWTFNSVKQSPCDVASSLMGVCEGDSYIVQKLPAGTHYVGPTIDGANECQCSTVTYSLLSACSQCQNRTMSSWSEWSANCVGSLYGEFSQPIPKGVFVPGWAYLNVKESGNFNASLAQSEANGLIESSALPISSAASSAPQISVPSATGTLEGGGNAASVNMINPTGVFLGEIILLVLAF